MGNNFFFFFGILAFIFILWVMTGGPDKPISFTGPYLTPITGPGQRSEAYTLGKGSSTSDKSSGANLSDLEAQIGDLSSFGEPSEYRGLVTFSRNPSGPRSTNEKEEYVSVSVSLRADDPITITGWRLESSATGVFAVIPGGVSVPRSGAVNPVSSVALSPGETAVITSGRSPIGASFKENLCTGYLTEFQSFVPELELSCPSGQQEFRAHYPDQDDTDCLSYLWRVPRCSVVRDAPSELSNQCEDFLETLNYNSCVDRYKGESDFGGDTWRIFIGSNRELWRAEHETIRLIDASGKTVDVLAY